MIARVFTVAFQGIDCLPIEVQAQLASGLPAFTKAGLIAQKSESPNCLALV